ncbi:MAG TPA: hypothetical protein VMF07_03980 [Solirubrobacteraceae bacterium]|nr:hypothetical protein [Solirubrobacteraceae bacterium]
MKRIIGAVAVVAALIAASAAIAASTGTYHGTSVLHLDGSTAAHPFSLTVKAGRITRASFLAGSNCEFLAESRGVPAKIKITANRFNGKILLRGGPMLHLIGRFSGQKVSGTFTGTTKPGSSNCAIPKTTFSAKRG